MLGIKVNKLGKVNHIILNPVSSKSSIVHELKIDTYANDVMRQIR